MNIFFVLRGELVTPPLSGSILPGVTRDTVLTLAREWKIPVEERPVEIDEVLKGAVDGTLSEAFGSGTAAVISPVGSFSCGGKETAVNGGRREISPSASSGRSPESSTGRSRTATGGSTGWNEVASINRGRPSGPRG